MNKAKLLLRFQFIHNASAKLKNVMNVFKKENCPCPRFKYPFHAIFYSFSMLISIPFAFGSISRCHDNKRAEHVPTVQANAALHHLMAIKPVHYVNSHLIPMAFRFKIKWLGASVYPEMNFNTKMQWFWIVRSVPDSGHFAPLYRCRFGGSLANETKGQQRIEQRREKKRFLTHKLMSTGVRPVALPHTYPMSGYIFSSFWLPAFLYVLAVSQPFPFYSWQHRCTKHRSRVGFPFT